MLVPDVTENIAMSNEPAERLPDLENDHAEALKAKTVNPMDLVSTSRYEGNPRELIENPGVAPEMLNEPDDLRSDEIHED